MKQNNKLSVEQISKLADDIRTIENFSENHNFDSGLLTARIKPGTTTKGREIDLPLWSMLFCFVLIVVDISVLIFVDSITQPAKNFMLLIGIVFVTLSCISAHRKFDNNTITIIAAAGGIIVLLIGAGVFTPKEAIDNIKDIAK